MPAFSKAASKAVSEAASAPVCEAAAFCPDSNRPTFRAITGLLPRHLPGDLHKSSSIRNAFQIQHNDMGMLILAQDRQDIGFIHVGVVAEADDARETKALAVGPVHDCGTKCARMRDEANRTPGGHGRRQKGCIQRQMGIDRADAVGAEQANAMAAGLRQAFLFERGAVGSNLAKPRRYDDGSFYAARPQSSMVSGVAWGGTIRMARSSGSGTWLSSV